jgi:hypothetical protein
MFGNKKKDVVGEDTPNRAKVIELLCSYILSNTTETIHNGIQIQIRELLHCAHLGLLCSMFLSSASCFVSQTGAAPQTLL